MRTDVNVAGIVEKYKVQMNALSAMIYSRLPKEDLMLLRFWMLLHETSEVHDLILPDSYALAPFIQLFQPPVAVIYAVDAQGELDNVAWFAAVDPMAKHQVAHGATYTRANVRGTKRHLHFTYLAYSLAFEFYDAILGTTWQPDLLKIHSKIGYNVVGCVPNMHDKAQLYYVHLTKDAFINSRLYKVATKGVKQ